MESLLELVKTEFSGSASSSAITSNATEINIAKLFAKEVFKLEKYFIAICNDVLVEVLSFGSRLRLGKLECVGRRFNWTVENFFGECPSIRLGFDLSARFTIFLNAKPKKRFTICCINWFLLSLATICHFALITGWLSCASSRTGG